MSRMLPSVALRCITAKRVCFSGRYKAGHKPTTLRALSRVWPAQKEIGGNGRIDYAGSRDS